MFLHRGLLARNPSVGLCRLPFRLHYHNVAVNKIRQFSPVERRFSFNSLRTLSESSQLQIVCCNRFNVWQNVWTPRMLYSQNYTNQRYLSTSQSCNNPRKSVIFMQNTRTDSKHVKTELQIKRENKTSSVPPPGEKAATKPTVLQRFKEAYKKYGITLIIVEIVSSILWFFGIFALIQSGVDMVSIMKKLGAPDSLIKKMSSEGGGDLASFLAKIGLPEYITKKFAGIEAGNLAVAFIIYKVIAPIRYLLVIVLTQVIVKGLQRRGLMKTPAVEDSIRNLVKDGRVEARNRLRMGRERIRGRRSVLTERWRLRREQMRQGFRVRSGNLRQRWTAARVARNQRLTEQTAKYRRSFDAWRNKKDK